MAEAKWYRLDKLVPKKMLNHVMWLLVCGTVFFLATTILGFGVSSSRAAKLAAFPVEPMEEAAAEAKYAESEQKITKMNDRDERIRAWFRAKLMLAGTRQESKATGLWRREVDLKQADLDRAAQTVYGQAQGQLREHPGKHDENIRMLEEALVKVRGSRYAVSVARLLEAEKAKRAAAASKAE